MDLGNIKRKKERVLYIILCNKLENLFQIDKFLEKHNPVSITQEEQTI